MLRFCNLHVQISRIILKLNKSHTNVTYKLLRVKAVLHGTICMIRFCNLHVQISRIILKLNKSHTNVTYKLFRVKAVLHGTICMIRFIGLLFGFCMIRLIWTERVNCKLVITFGIKICIKRFLKDGMSSISSDLLQIVPCKTALRTP